MTATKRESAEIPAGTLAELYGKLCGDDGRTLDQESDEVDGYRTVASSDDGESRWTHDYSLIVRRVADGQLFACDYLVGLTEYQECQYPWGPAIAGRWDSEARAYVDLKPITCYPVVAETKTVVTTTYRRA
jgi:hypothetical protein